MNSQNRDETVPEKENLVQKLGVAASGYVCLCQLKMQRGKKATVFSVVESHFCAQTEASSWFTGPFRSSKSTGQQVLRIHRVLAVWLGTEISINDQTVRAANIQTYNLPIEFKE